MNFTLIGFIFTIITILFLAFFDRKWLKSLTRKERLIFWIGFILTYSIFIITNKICHYYFIKWWDMFFGFVFGISLMLLFGKFYYKIARKLIK